ncbi:MAG: hypothetical protein M1833_002363 [Piccolia ochrophora]|nr:MAG: hypothetical protein M1833_002363 [Piccolia ochrophora]
MTLLDTHLEQISLCASAIGDLPFPQPKIFTNALLHPHDITALIRDTEAHERALFSLPPVTAPTAQDPSKSHRRTTTFNAQGGDSYGAHSGFSGTAPRRTTAVAAVLGGDMVEQIRRGGGGGVGSALGFAQNEPRDRGEVDVEVLLKGAEKLCSVYPIRGVAEKILSLRTRHDQLRSSIAHYERRVAAYTTQLERLNRPRDYDGEDDEDDNNELLNGDNDVEEEVTNVTEEDLRQEEEEIKELERKRRTLEDRVSGMERDLGGLMR